MASLAISLETLSSDTSKHIFTISKYLMESNLALPSFDNESLAIFLSDATLEIIGARNGFHKAAKDLYGLALRPTEI